MDTIAELLATYIDVLNRYGSDAPDTRSFEREHVGDEVLVQLMRAAKEVHGLFESGQLR
jgi:hypothetical protein